MSYGTHHALYSGVRFSQSPSSAKGKTMKMLNVFAPKSAFLAARERFYRVRQRFELWTLNGPTAMRVLGRASW
jgi:hypothetical protein